MAQSSIIGWNLANFVSVVLMIMVVWLIVAFASHFVFRRGGTPTGFASTTPQAAGAPLGGSSTMALAA